MTNKCENSHEALNNLYEKIKTYYLMRLDGGILSLKDSLAGEENHFLRRGLELVIKIIESAYDLYNRTQNENHLPENNISPELIEYVLGTEHETLIKYEDHYLTTLSLAARVLLESGDLLTINSIFEAADPVMTRDRAEEIYNLIERLAAFSDKARAEGLLTLEDDVAVMGKKGIEGFIRHGLFLVTDGTDPDIVKNILKNKTEAILREKKLLDQINIQGILGIQSGDNPRIVRSMLLSFTTATDFDYDSSNESLNDFLSSTPGPDCFSETIHLLTSLSNRARYEGLLDLESELDKINDPVLKFGLRAVIDHVDPELVRDLCLLRAKAEEFLNAIPLEIVMMGILSIQAGDIGQAVREQLIRLVPPRGRENHDNRESCSDFNKTKEILMELARIGLGKKPSSIADLINDLNEPGLESIFTDFTQSVLDAENKNQVTTYHKFMDAVEDWLQQRRMERVFIIYGVLSILEGFDSSALDGLLDPVIPLEVKMSLPAQLEYGIDILSYPTRINLLFKAALKGLAPIDDFVKETGRVIDNGTWFECLCLAHIFIRDEWSLKNLKLDKELNEAIRINPIELVKLTSEIVKPHYEKLEELIFLLDPLRSCLSQFAISTGKNDYRGIQGAVEASLDGTALWIEKQDSAGIGIENWHDNRVFWKNVAEMSYEKVISAEISVVLDNSKPTWLIYLTARSLYAKIVNKLPAANLISEFIAFDHPGLIASLTQKHFEFLEQSLDELKALVSSVENIMRGRGLDPLIDLILKRETAWELIEVMRSSADSRFIDSNPNQKLINAINPFRVYACILNIIIDNLGTEKKLYFSKNFPSILLWDRDFSELLPDWFEEFASMKFHAPVKKSAGEVLEDENYDPGIEAMKAGLFHFSLGEAEQALEFFNQALGKHPMAPIYISASLALQDKTREAMETLAEWFAEEPEKHLEKGVILGATLVKAIMRTQGKDFIIKTHFREDRIRYNFEFEDILILDDRSLQILIYEIGRDPIIKALKNADEKIMDKFFKNMSPREVEMIRDQMRCMEDFSEADILEARKMLVAYVRRLEDAGEIVIARSCFE